MALLETHRLSKRFGGLAAVEDVDFALERGQIVSVIGPNGAGKSTFFNVITGLYRPSGGRVLVDGRDVTGKRPDVVLRHGVARTYQNIRLFANMTVLENVLAGQHTRLHSGLLGSLLKGPRTRREEREATARAYELMDLFGDRLARHGNTLARNLAYADRRYVEIARALASRPEVLLLDEPTVGMNPAETEEAMRHIARLRAAGLSIVLIEHKLNVVMSMSDRVVVLDYGRKIAEGTPDEVRNDERVVEAYLGRQKTAAGIDIGAPGVPAPASGSAGVPIPGSTGVPIPGSTGVPIPGSTGVPPAPVSTGSAGFQPAPVAPTGSADGSPATVAPDAIGATMPARNGRTRVMIAPIGATSEGRAAGTLLEFRGVHVAYGAIEALHGVDYRVDADEIVCLLGANGAGKTTTMRVATGVVRPSRGEVFFGGGRIDTRTPREIVRAGVAAVPEGRRVFARMTVAENLEMGALTRGDRAAIAADLARVFDLFPRLKERRNQLAGLMSGGEQQMLAIGRALMARPRLLLLDEPSMGLSPIYVERVFDTIREINRQGVTIFMVEQNANMALAVAGRGYLLQTGTVVLHDTAPNLLASDLVRRTYLGDTVRV